MYRFALAIIGLVVVIGSAAGAAAPRPDFDNFPAYIRALQNSRTPEARKILRQIKSGPADLARERAAAIRAGIPLDFQHLRKPIPPSENAAPLYQRLQKLLQKKPLNLPAYAYPMSSRYAYTPEQIAAVRKIVSARQDVFTLLHQAENKPCWDFDPDPTSDIDIGDIDPNIGVPVYAPLWECERLLETRTYLLEKDGKFLQAVANQVYGFRIAQQIVQKRIVPSYLAAFGMDVMTLNTMNAILSMAGPNTVVNQAVETAVAEHHMHLFRRVLIGEATGGLALMTNVQESMPGAFDTLHSLIDLHSQTPPHIQKLSAPEQRFLNDLIDAAEADYLHRMERLIAVAEQPDKIRRPVFASVTNFQKNSHNPVLLYSALMLNLPVLRSVPNLEDSRRAGEEVVIAGAAVLAEKAKTGQWPSRLPKPFPDPFRGKILQYRREGAGGFVVYSVGPTGKFDGGPPGQDRYPGEIYFRYPAPPPIPVPKDMQ